MRPSSRWAGLGQSNYRVVGPLSSPRSHSIHVSRFGVIPKGSSGKWRLVLDLSSPEGASVNSGIDKTLCSLSYATVDEAVSQVVHLGRGALMAKLDIKTTYRLVPDQTDATMLWAAAYMRFFGFLQSGEIVVPSATTCNPAVHLSYGDVKADNISTLQYIEVIIKASKTDPFWKGVTVYLGSTGATLCPVAAIW